VRSATATATAAAATAAARPIYLFFCPRLTGN